MFYAVFFLYKSMTKHTQLTVETANPRKDEEEEIYIDIRKTLKMKCIHCNCIPVGA